MDMHILRHLDGLNSNRYFSFHASNPAIFKATSSFFSSQGWSPDEVCLDLSCIFYKIRKFRKSAFTVIFHSMKRDARFKFDSGAISLNQSQFLAMHSNQSVYFILYRQWMTSNCYFVFVKMDIWLSPRVPRSCSCHILTSSVIYYLTDARQH